MRFDGVDCFGNPMSSSTIEDAAQGAGAARAQHDRGERRRPADPRRDRRRGNRLRRRAWRQRRQPDSTCCSSLRLALRAARWRSPTTRAPRSRRAGRCWRRDGPDAAHLSPISRSTPAPPTSRRRSPQVLAAAPRRLPGLRPPRDRLPARARPAGALRQRLSADAPAAGPGRSCAAPTPRTPGSRSGRPRLGWVDLDPTNGVSRHDEHVTVAWGRDYGDVSPISGVLFGGGGHAVSVGVDVEPMADGGEAPR